MLERHKWGLPLLGKLRAFPSGVAEWIGPTGEGLGLQKLRECLDSFHPLRYTLAD